MKEKKNKIQKGALLTVLMGLALAFPFCGARANWPVGNVYEIPGVSLGEAIQAVREQTQNVILARLQQEALRRIRQTMAEFVAGGNTSRSYIISDYEDFIYGASSRRAEISMSQFFRQLNKGISEGERDALREVEQRLKEELFPKTPIKQTIGAATTSDDPYSNIFLDRQSGEYTTDVYTQMQTSGTDHPNDIYNSVKAGVLAYTEQQQDIQRTIAIANQGFIPQNGVPGSVISQIVAATEIAPINMISNAVSVEQVADNISISTLTTFMERGYNIFSHPASNQATRINQSVEGGVGALQELIYRGNHTMPYVTGGGF